MRKANEAHREHVERIARAFGEASIGADVESVGHALALILSGTMFVMASEVDLQERLRGIDAICADAKDIHRNLSEGNLGKALN